MFSIRPENLFLLRSASQKSLPCSLPSRVTRTSVPLFLAILSFSTLTFAAGKQTFIGELGDAMCGSKHMEGTPAECTRTCVSKGSKYALVVGEKIYTLDTSDKKLLETLNQLAGKNIKVTGTLNKDSIEVASVASAK